MEVVIGSQGKELRMARQPNTTSKGAPFDEDTIEKVWEKATLDLSAPIFKKDRCGYRMLRDKYGITENYGWEIDHIKPVAKGGTDELKNLQPLYWKNNRSKSDNYPWDCE
jgi:hypothetical protein